jgi:hypothetical protein
MQNLSEAKKILNRLKVKYWLDCGTLLSAVREGRQDPQDDDISIMAEDVGIVAQNLSKFIKKGFRIHQVYSHPNMGITEISFRRNERAFDIFIYYPKGKFIYAVSWYDRHIYRKLPIVEQTKTIILFDKFPIPQDDENYLINYYGEDWRTPKTEWNPIADPPCICDDSFLN